MYIVSMFKLLKTIINENFLPKSEAKNVVDFRLIQKTIAFVFAL